VGFDDHFEQLNGAVQKLHFSVSQLLKFLFLELTKTNLKQFLLVESMGKLHEHKNVIVLSLWYHVLTKYLDERVNFKKFDDWEVINDFSSWELYCIAVETFEYIREILGLNIQQFTLKFYLMESVTMLAVKFLLK